MSWPVLIGIPLGVAVWARSSQIAGALVVATAVVWVAAALAAHWALNQFEYYPALLYWFVVLPCVLAPTGGVLVARLSDARGRGLHCAAAAIAGCVIGIKITLAAAHADLRECLSETAAPSVLAVSAAGLAAALGRRRRRL